MYAITCYRLQDGTIVEGQRDAIRTAENRKGDALTAFARRLVEAGRGGKPFSGIVEYLDTPEALETMRRILALQLDIEIIDDRD